MVAHTIINILFTSLALVSASLVIRAQNPVHSVLFLILVFCNASGLLVLLGLDFFAMILLVVYVGAIAVLFWATVRLPVVRHIDVKMCATIPHIKLKAYPLSM
jgi:NADH:ubiquinone oxidoreductase subunit 6 (subunit J)